MDDDLLDETADLIMERYRVLANTSKLPGTHLETPFGTVDESMQASIRSVLDEVKSLDDFLSLHSQLVALQHQQMHRT